RGSLQEEVDRGGELVQVPAAVINVGPDLAFPQEEATVEAFPQAVRVPPPDVEEGMPAAQRTDPPAGHGQGRGTPPGGGGEPADDEPVGRDRETDPPAGHFDGAVAAVVHEQTDRANLVDPDLRVALSEVARTPPLRAEHLDPEPVPAVTAHPELVRLA